MCMYTQTRTQARTHTHTRTHRWSNQLLANTSAGIVAYVPVATPLRHECRRTGASSVECEVQGEDAGGRAFSDTNIQGCESIL